MRAYADSSFILHLITEEAESTKAIAEYRRVGLPALFFLPLHVLEVRNSILQRAFHQRRSQPSGDRRQIARERDTALDRLERFIARRTLIEVTPESDAVMEIAFRLSTTYTERTGARAIDILHVASALTLESELFLTTDIRQGDLAAAEGLKVISTRLVK
jgi:predicted nucleic acid-binding protein